jgi:methionyl-tRNA formyltransferase
MLPEMVWKMPPLGTFNLHASLLPRYRGAAPINHAIMHGDKETGITTFFLQHEIDTGNIILQRSTPIGPDETAGELHDRLMQMGAVLVLETVKSIEDKSFHLIRQEDLVSDDVLHAPKIFRDDCRINWQWDARKIHDFIRGLSPSPGAWTEMTAEGKKSILKIYRTSIAYPGPELDNGILAVIAGKIRVGCSNGSIEIMELQAEGKKRITADEFVRGLRDSDQKLLV